VASVKKAPLALGMLMSVSFFGVLLLILSPVFGGKNGLDYADDLFNKLSKGSSYFIPELLKKNQSNMGKAFRATLVLENETGLITRICASAGARTELQGTTLRLEGDLGRFLSRALQDADHVFNNGGSKVAESYQQDEKQVMRTWWIILTKMERYFKKNLQVKESDTISEVVRKGIEPAYNYYNVESQKVSERWGVMSLMLIFYVIYTLWWGYAILFLFEGLGLNMKKAKVKKEMG
jgi:hypothetical protein